MAEKVVIDLLESDSDSDDGIPAPTALLAKGQTQAALISEEEYEMFTAPRTKGISNKFATSQFIDQLPSAQLHAAASTQRPPTKNDIPSAAPPAAPRNYTSGLSNGSTRPQPLQALPHYQSPKPDKSIESFFVQSIPLPKFHEMPAQKIKPRVATPKSKLASRPHPQSSAGSPQSPERKRMRLGDSNNSRAPYSGSSNHEGSLNHKRRNPPLSHPNFQQSMAARVAGGHYGQSPLARTLNHDGVKSSSSPVSILAGVTSDGSKKRNHNALTGDDMFPLETSIGKEKLRDISSDVQARLADTSGNRAIHRILVAAESLSDLADLIIVNFTESENKALAQQIKSNFDKSFKDLQQEHANSEIPDERKAFWILATVYHGITLVGMVSVPESQPMPERDIMASQRQRLISMPSPGNEKAIPSVEEEDEDIDMVAVDTPRQRTGNFIMKAGHYRDVDVLRLKGMADRERRPYIAKDHMKSMRLGAKTSTSAEALKARSSRIISVPFTAEESAAVRDAVTKWYNGPDRTLQDMDNVSRVGHHREFLSRVASYVATNILYNPRRPKQAYHEFLRDFESVAKFLGQTQHAPQELRPIAMVRKRITRVVQDGGSNSCNIQALSRTRDMAANIDRATQKLRSLVQTQLDDSIVRDVQFVGGPGDIASFTWLSEDEFLIGAITNCDPYNQDYNKPGNLVIGSAKSKIAKAIPGHRIPRPPKAQKDDTAVVDSQDPWLYSSVPMTAFDSRRNICFTASYDKTVKIWRASEEELAMDLLGTWHHEGPVNLIVISPHHSKAATASDVRMNGIRVYDLDRGDLDSLRPRMYSGSRAREIAGKTLTWAYYPSTMQWGMSQAASHFLVVGYSPRSLEVHSEVPWDKKNSGQLCVWDTRSNSEVMVAGPKAQNVFEVVWHPSQVVFVAATAAAGDFDEGIKTQLRLFVYRDSTNAFAAVKTFECFGADINEITLRPSSYKEVYLTASCTDGKTYVWDSAQGDYPIHVLCHGVPIDPLDEKQDAEDVDAGVKFAAWGRTADRFYTGSSDGALKVWNIRASRGEEFLGDLLFAPGGISCGVFSPDRTRLAIGDTSGKLHLLKIWEKDFDQKPVFTHAAIRPFYERAPPMSGGIEKAREFCLKGQLYSHRDKYIGVLQGPNYASTGLYRAEKHPGGNLNAIPEDVLKGQRDRKKRDKLIVPRLPSAKNIQPKHTQAGMIFSKLCACGFQKEEARLVGHHCGGMGMSLTACSIVYKDKLDVHIALPNSYEPEAEGPDPFQQHGSASSSALKADHKFHYLGKCS